MSLKPRARRVLVVSNIPTPYNDALFGELAAQDGVELRVLYGAGTESNRSWHLTPDKPYVYDVLPGQTLGVSAHLNPGVVRAVRAFRPTVAVLTGSYTMPTIQLAAAALRAVRSPWVYWGEELAHGAATPAVRAGRRALRWVSRHARGVFAIGSRACASYARAGVRAERIADFRYYADTPRFALRPDERAAARAELRGSLGLPDDATAVLYCGQLIARKGVDTLVRAIARTTRAGDAPGPHLLLAGDGPERGALEALAASLGVASRVSVLGFRQPETLPRVFAAADAFALPSHQEGWGVVVPEAMAAGLPVLASARVNAAADLVVDGATGWRFEPGDVDRVCELLRLIAADPGRRAGMGAAARQAVRAESPAVAAPRMVRLLDAARAGRALAGL